MIKSTFFGEEFSELVPLLLSKKGQGYVHSIFSNGFNLNMDDSLIFIGNRKNGLLPFGIHLQENDTFKAVSSVKNGEAVYWDAKTNALQFSTISISLDKGQSFHNEITPLQNDRLLKTDFERFCSQLTAIKGLTGLDVDINLFLNKWIDTGKKEWLGSEPYLMKLIDAVTSSDTDLIEKVLRYFLGRGKGLTPSGDDLIVGLFAFDATSNFISSLFYQQLSRLLESEPITTDVGREYLRYAARHEFSSTVTDLLNLLASDDHVRFNQAFQNLLSVGHSSGMDTLLGILIGMLAFDKVT